MSKIYRPSVRKVLCYRGKNCKNNNIGITHIVPDYSQIVWPKIPILEPKK